MKLILDTNVVLDWLVFRDTNVAALQPALDQGRVEIVTHAPALDELRRVLAYSQFKLAADEQQEMLERYNSCTRLTALPANVHVDDLPAGFPRCRDRDDQHFLTLAYYERSALLVSKDAAVLELTHRAQKFGITVIDPRQLAAKLADLTVHG